MSADQGRYDEFIDGALTEIGAFLTSELGYETDLIKRDESMPLSTLAVAIPKDAAGNDRYLSVMVMPADVEGYKVVFLQLHMIIPVRFSDARRADLEALMGRVNEKFLLGSFVFFFDSLCMKYGLAFDREDGVDMLALTRAVALFIWQADVFSPAFFRLAAGECTLAEAVTMATGE